MHGYYQLIEGHNGGFMFVLRAGNHEAILESGLYWSRQAALDAVDALRRLSQEPTRLKRHESAAGLHWLEVVDDNGKPIARTRECATRSALSARIASVQHNAVSPRFRGLVRRELDLG